MGMNFSPMYQPVSTKTIKADGDLNINPYDLLATDVKCDTVEATEFVGGVGNFDSTLADSITCNYIGLYGNITETQTSYTYAVSDEYDLSITTSETEVIIPYNYSYNLPIKLNEGVYITETLGDIPSVFTRTLSLQLKTVVSGSNAPVTFYYKLENDNEYTIVNLDAVSKPRTFTMDVETGSRLTYYLDGAIDKIQWFKLSACPTYYLTLTSPTT